MLLLFLQLSPLDGPTVVDEPSRLLVCLGFDGRVEFLSGVLGRNAALPKLILDVFFSILDEAPAIDLFFWAGLVAFFRALWKSALRVEALEPLRDGEDGRFSFFIQSSSLEIAGLFTSGGEIMMRSSSSDSSPSSLVISNSITSPMVAEMNILAKFSHSFKTLTLTLAYFIKMEYRGECWVMLGAALYAYVLPSGGLIM